MPIYSLGCPKCEHRCERECPIAKRNEQPCPKCSTKMEVLICSGGFKLKGGGWAEDGYSYTSREIYRERKRDDE
jgi:putative FmdB family regulatory protein